MWVEPRGWGHRECSLNHLSGVQIPSGHTEGQKLWYQQGFCLLLLSVQEEGTYEWFTVKNVPCPSLEASGQKAMHPLPIAATSCEPCNGPALGVGDAELTFFLLLCLQRALPFLLPHISISVQ